MVANLIIKLTKKYSTENVNSKNTFESVNGSFTLQKFEIQGGFGGGDLDICSDCRGFRIIEIQIIECKS